MVGSVAVDRMRSEAKTPFNRAASGLDCEEINDSEPENLALN